VCPTLGGASGYRRNVDCFALFSDVVKDFSREKEDFLQNCAFGPSLKSEKSNKATSS
jgi:hypothetical protein